MELPDRADTQSEFGGGVVYIVSGLKTWLETGESIGPETAEPEPVAAR